MPPTLRICALRPTRLLRPSNAVIGVKRSAACRSFADEKGDASKLPQARMGESGPNMQQQEHVSEEAAKMANITGSEGPDMDVGTPIQEIMTEEKDTRDDAPQVLQEQVDNTNTRTQPSTTSTSPPSGKRAFSTYARRRLEMQPTSSTPPLDPSMLSTSITSSLLPDYTQPQQPQTAGHKFPLPTLPLPPNARKDFRGDPVVDQIVGLLQVDGKKSVAQRNMAVILNTLRTSPAPTYSPSRSLLPGAPPASHLSLNPILYLTLAIDSVAPLMRLRSQRGAAGGGVALQIPVPLGLRQRRRQAFTWILDAASKRPNKGSGKDMFAQRVAQELISVVEGRSGVWEKRNAVHRLATTSRMNLNFGRSGFRR